MSNSSLRSWRWVFATIAGSSLDLLLLSLSKAMMPRLVRFINKEIVGLWWENFERRGWQLGGLMRPEENKLIDSCDKNNRLALDRRGSIETRVCRLLRCFSFVPVRKYSTFQMNWGVGTLLLRDTTPSEPWWNFSHSLPSMSGPNGINITVVPLGDSKVPHFVSNMREIQKVEKVRFFTLFFVFLYEFY